MATRAELVRLQQSNDQLSKMIRAELSDFFGSLDLSKPEAARDALLEYMPILVSEYGGLSEAIAMQWYEEVREAAGKPAVRAVAAVDAIPAEAVAAKVRYGAGALWTPAPESALGGLLVAADKYVKQPGRSTIQYNATRNGSRWGRVPQGGKTCSFCLTLASRDAVYMTRDSAISRADGGKYHGLCDCVPVEMDSEDDYPDGYNPSELYEVYQIARDRAGSGDIKDIAAAMRREFPDLLTDGIAAA